MAVLTFVFLTPIKLVLKKVSLEQQIHLAIAEAVSRSNEDHINYRIIKFFIEPGISGTSDKRPQLQMMQRDIARRKYGFVVFKEIARIARDSLIWKNFFRLCIEYDCEIFIRGLPFNPNDPTALMQIDLLASFAAYESQTTSKRTRESNFFCAYIFGKIQLYQESSRSRPAC